MSEHWICTACKEPIDGDHWGFIDIRDVRSREMPHYNPDADEQMVALDDDGSVNFDETSRLQTDAAIQMVRDPGVDFYAYHHDCLEDAREEYWIDTTRVSTIERWHAWVFHMAEKNWMRKRDLTRMLSFWYSGHGMKTPHDLG